MADIIYPTVEKIIGYNLLALELIKVKKADRAEVLNKSIILDVIRECQETTGDIYDKAIRENFYSNAEMKEWMHHGKIKEFRRR